MYIKVYTWNNALCHIHVLITFIVLFFLFLIFQKMLSRESAPWEFSLPTALNVYLLTWRSDGPSSLLIVVVCCLNLIKCTIYWGVNCEILFILCYLRFRFRFSKCSYHFLFETSTFWLGFLFFILSILFPFSVCDK